MTTTFHAKRNSAIYKYLKGETTEESSTHTVIVQNEMKGFNSI